MPPDDAGCHAHACVGMSGNRPKLEHAHASVGMAPTHPRFDTFRNKN
jgi:hypothetical protein